MLSMYENMTPDEIYDAAQERGDHYRRFFHLGNIATNVKYNNIVLGADNIPKGPAVFVGNHVRKIDSTLLSLAVTKTTDLPLRMLAKSDYFDPHTLGEKLNLIIITNTGAIPVDRRDLSKEKMKKLSQRALGVLAAGESIGVHGEGTRTDYLHRFHNSMMRVAMEAGVPMVPFACQYPETSGLHRPVAITQFGEAITPEEYHSDSWLIYPGKANKANHAAKVLNDRVAGLMGIPHHRRVFDFAPIPPRKNKE